MLKHVTMLLAPLLCAKTWLMFLFGGNGVLGMGLQRDRVSLLHSCSNENVTSLWCHLGPEILPWLCHPTASPQPFCLSVGEMCSDCTLLVQPTQIPDKVSIFRNFASKGKLWVRHRGSAPYGGSPAGQRFLIPATWGIENHKSSAPGGIVILPRVSPKEQHHTCQDVKALPLMCYNSLEMKTNRVFPQGN